MTVVFSNDRLQIRRSGEHSRRALVVAFDSYTDDRRLDRMAFGELFSEKHGIDMIFVLSRDNDWYQYEELPEALAKVADIASGYERVIAYGSSMGGYAAIRFGKWAGAREAVALSPQYSVNPAVCPWEIRWALDAARIEFLIEPRRDGIVDHATIFFDPADVDAKHVALYEALCRVRPIPLRNAGHPCGGFLAGIGVLSKAVTDLAHGTFDANALRKACRRLRGQSGQYLLTIASRLPPRRRHTKLEILKRVRRVAEHDAGLQSLLGEQLTKVGRHDEAEAAHRKALAAFPSQPAFVYRFADSLDLSGRRYDAMCAMARLNFTHPIPVYCERYGVLYWQCFREAEKSYMTQDQVEIAVATTPSPPQNVTAWRRHLMQMDALADASPSLYLIGDSHAEFWPQEVLPPGAFNLGNAGDKTQSVLWRLEQIEAQGLLKSRPCVVVAGANNLGMGDTAESIVAGLTRIKAKLQTMIGNQSMTFVAIPPCGENGHFRNDERLKANALMKRTMQTLDFEPEIRALGASAFMPDTIHLTALAYSKMPIRLSVAA